jgi:hypothetical protein
MILPSPFAFRLSLCELNFLTDFHNCLEPAFPFQSLVSPFALTNMANNNGIWPGEHSPTLRNDQMAAYSRTAFSNLTDFDDQEDTAGGGVMLRDYDDGGHFAPTPTNSAASSGQSHSQESRSRNSMSSNAFSRSSTSARRNTIAPIGTGRYAESGYAQKTNASVDEDAVPRGIPTPSPNVPPHWLFPDRSRNLNTKTTSDEGHGQKPASDDIGTTGANFTQTAAQSQAGMTVTDSTLRAW